MIEAQKVLVRMFDSLPERDLLKFFLSKHCNHLLQLGFSKTGAMSSVPLTSYPVSSGISPVSPSSYTRLAGVYAFTCVATGVLYIGSALCLNTRFKQHISDSSSPNRGGNNQFYRFVRSQGG
jgi:hypothetical protein